MSSASYIAVLFLSSKRPSSVISDLFFSRPKRKERRGWLSGTSAAKHRAMWDHWFEETRSPRREAGHVCECSYRNPRQSGACHRELTPAGGEEQVLAFKLLT